MATKTIRQLETIALRAQSIMLREQKRGESNISVQQTRRMYLSVTAAQRAHQNLHMARMSLMLRASFDCR